MTYSLLWNLSGAMPGMASGAYNPFPPFSKLCKVNELFTFPHGSPMACCSRGESSEPASSSGKVRTVQVCSSSNLSRLRSQPCLLSHRLRRRLDGRVASCSCNGRTVQDFTESLASVIYRITNISTDLQIRYRKMCSQPTGLIP